MEPELPTPRLNPERGPAPVERVGEEVPLDSPEQTPERSAERFEQRSEAGSRVADTAPVTQAPVVNMQVGADAAAGAPSSVKDDMPVSASDDDLIEKEWVDKAKQIISRTKDDPYRREQEISRLQVEYLKKRYGKELGVSS